MARSLDFIQIYYDEVQLSEMYEFATPYYNTTLTPYFENSVISDLVPKLNADLISVCSWRLKKKRMDRAYQLNGKTELTKDKIVNTDYDVAVLTPTSGSHKPLQMASHWHGKPWDDAIVALRKFIKIPTELKKGIYENHFIATKEVYHDYVRNCLNPAIDFISTNQCFFVNANYAKRKTEDERKRYTSVTGREDWPIAPFILERLFSIWIDDKNLKVINL
jgi:hypothetical protein